MKYNDFKFELKKLIIQNHFSPESADIIITNLGFVFFAVYSKADDLNGAIWYVCKNFTELSPDDFENWHGEERYWCLDNKYLVKGGEQW